MKHWYIKLLLAVGLFGSVAVAHAQVNLFGYSATLTAVDTAGFYTETVTGQTLTRCELRRANLITNWTALGRTFVSRPNCSPIVLNIDPDWREKHEFRAIDWSKPFPWPDPWPECLSCPFLQAENIDLIYPQAAGKVKELMKEYGIDQYNEELKSLQKNFNLKGFEAKMHNLEMQLLEFNVQQQQKQIGR